MADRRRYIFTRHLRERFVQRTNKRFEHLQTCKNEDCNLCYELNIEIDKILEARRPVDQEIARRLDAASECKSYLNDARFMDWFYDKYGWDKRFEFLVNDKITFVVVEERGRKVVVTCIDSKNYTVVKSTLRPKFNGIKKKREKDKEKKLLEMMDSIPTFEHQ